MINTLYETFNTLNFIKSGLESDTIPLDEMKQKVVEVQDKVSDLITLQIEKAGNKDVNTLNKVMRVLDNKERIKMNLNLTLTEGDFKEVFDMFGAFSIGLVDAIRGVTVELKKEEFLDRVFETIHKVKNKSSEAVPPKEDNIEEERPKFSPKSE